jgi:hypothetical protein
MSRRRILLLGDGDLAEETAEALLRVALLVRHLDPDVPIVATIFDPETGRERGGRRRAAGRTALP